MKLKELTNEEFLMFTANFPMSSVFQTPEYAMVMNKQDYETFYLGLVNDNNQIVAASLILVESLNKFLYAYAPRGYLIDYNDETLVKTFTDEIKRFLNKKNIMAIKISPLIPRAYLKNNAKERVEVSNYENIYKYLKKIGYYHLGYNRYFEAFKPRFEAIIHLDSNIHAMFKKVKKEFRTKIRMSDRNGVRIYRGTSENLPYFYEMTKNKYPRDLKYFQDTYQYYQRRNMVDLYFALLDTKHYLLNAQKELQFQNMIANQVTEEVFRHQGQANSKLINRKIAEDNKLAECKNRLVYATNLLNRNPDGIILASVMIIKYKKEAYLLMDGYDENYKPLNAKHLLIWKLMEKYAQEGYETFNLGGVVDPENVGDYKGLNEFRLGFGADVTEYLGDLEYITSKPLYMMYRNMAPFRHRNKDKK